MILSKSLNLIGCHGNIKGKFSKKYSKIFSSEAVSGMKLKLCVHVHDINLYINCIFIVIVHVFLLLWQLKVSIDLWWEKWKLAFISVLLQMFWKKVLQKCFWRTPLPTMWILSKSLILIGCHGNRKTKCLKKKIKNLLLRSHNGNEAETLHKCSWY